MANLTRVAINVSASGDNTVIAAVAGQAIHIDYLELENLSSNATTVIFKDGTTAINGAGAYLNSHDQYTFGALQADDLNASVRRAQITTAVGNAFVINLSGANSHGGFALYSQEAN